MDPGLQKILISLNYIQYVLESSDKDIKFLAEFLQNRKVHRLVKVCCVMNKVLVQSMGPCGVDFAASLVNESCYDIRQHQHRPDVRELMQILQNKHMQTLLRTHDVISSSDYEPQLPDIPYEVDEDEEFVKIINLIKNDEPLGATIHMGKSGSIEIARIMHGGAADRSGLIHQGDKLFEVNGVDVQGKAPDDLVKILTASSGTVMLKLAPADQHADNVEGRTRLRALFDYDPFCDSFNPCPEASLAFRKADILHVVSQHDPLWWQAHKEGDSIKRAALIPSRLLQERRHILKDDNDNEDGDIDDVDLEKKEVSDGLPARLGQISQCLHPHLVQVKKLKKMMYYVMQSPIYDADEVITYEEVDLYLPSNGIFRPIILIGPPGVGRNELKRRLIASSQDHFVDIVPYTSRPKRAHEQDGKEYYFVSREVMENGILIGRFAEHGEYKGNLYGSSLESIMKAIDSGKVCVLSPHPQALKLLYTSDFKPYVIYVKPPPLDVLTATRLACNARKTIDENSTRTFTDADFEETVQKAQTIDFTYNHFFNATILNDDLTTASNELIRIAKALETEQFWVPITWI